MPFKIFCTAFDKIQIFKSCRGSRLTALHYYIGVFLNRQQIDLGMCFCVFYRKATLSAAYLKVQRTLGIKQLTKVKIRLVIYCGIEISVLAVRGIKITACSLESLLEVLFLSPSLF